MNTILKNSLAVIIGLFLGGIVNMGIIMLSSSIIPPPDGVDVNDMESIKSSMHLYQPRHFIFPFLAHAIGTLVGAFSAALIAANHQLKFAMAIGVFFLIGGIVAVFMLPSPLLFTLIDLVFAYLPMAYLGYLWARSMGRK